jgi:putative transposase
MATQRKTKSPSEDGSYMKSNLIKNPHARELRIGRYSQENQIYFITKCINRSSGIDLSTQEIGKVVCESILFHRSTGVWKLLLFVVMPDHVHLLVGLGESKSLSRSMADFSKFTAAKINLILKKTGSVWQKGFYEHQIRRSAEKCPDLLAYIHQNPVRRGLCKNTEEWVLSTAHPAFTKDIDADWFW